MNYIKIISVFKKLLGEIKAPISFYSLGILFIIFNIIKTIFEIATKFAILKIKYSVMKAIFEEALSDIFQARWEFFNNHTQGYILATLNKNLSVLGDSLGATATMLAQFIQLAIYISVPLYLNPIMTTITIALVVLFRIPIVLSNKLSYKLGQRNAETADAALSILSEILQSLKLIISYGRQSVSMRWYLNAWDEHTSATLKSQILSAAIPALFKPLVMISILIATGVSLSLNANVSELAAVLWSMLASVPIMMQLAHGNVTINNFVR